jgi:hypothetical protein
MKSKLMTIAGAALFMLALEFNATASTYDVNGNVHLFPLTVDDFSGTLTLVGNSVTAADITLSGSNLNSSDLVLTDVASSTKTGGLWSVTVENSLYDLFFFFTLPRASNNFDGNVALATLSEFVDVCTRTHGCQEVPELLGGLGTGTVTPFSIGTASVTPLPPALPLFATALGLFGLFLWRGKRNTAENLTAV